MSSAVIINLNIKDKFMKKLTTAIAVATLTVSVPALADTATVATPTTTEVSTQDLIFAFDDAENLQAVAMTNDEMQDTQGAWAVPGAIAGAGIGAWGYMGGVAGSGNFSWTGLGATVAGGAAVGAITGPVGISRYYTAARVAGASGFLNSQVNK